jgi:hypothetical protein
VPEKVNAVRLCRPFLLQVALFLVLSPIARADTLTYALQLNRLYISVDGGTPVLGSVTFMASGDTENVITSSSLFATQQGLTLPFTVALPGLGTATVTDPLTLGSTFFAPDFSFNDATGLYDPITGFGFTNFDSRALDLTQPGGLNSGRPGTSSLYNISLPTSLGTLTFQRYIYSEPYGVFTTSEDVVATTPEPASGQLLGIGVCLLLLSMHLRPARRERYADSHRSSDRRP